MEDNKHLILSKKYYNQKEYSKALDEINICVSLFPKSLILYEMKCEILFKLEQYTSIISTVQDCFEINNKITQTLFTQWFFSSLYVYKTPTNQTYEFITKITKTFSKTFFYNTSLLCMQHNYYHAALSLLNIISESPREKNTYEINIALIECYKGLHYFSDAITIYESIYNKYKNLFTCNTYLTGYYLYSECYLFHKAEECLIRARENNPTKNELEYISIQSIRNDLYLHKYDNVILKGKELILENVFKYSYVFLFMACAYGYNKDESEFDKCISKFKAMNNMNQPNEEYYYWLGKYNNKNSIDKIKSYLIKALSIKPSYLPCLEEYIMLLYKHSQTNSNYIINIINEYIEVCNSYEFKTNNSIMQLKNALQKEVQTLEMKKSIIIYNKEEPIEIPYGTSNKVLYTKNNKCLITVTNDKNGVFILKEQKTENHYDEAEIYEKLSKNEHANIIKCIDCNYRNNPGFPNERSEIKLELAKGSSLNNHLTKETSIMFKYKCILNIARGLNFLHEKMGIIHFDIKPENVFLDKIYYLNDNNNNYFTLPTLKISDFGSSLFNKLNTNYLEKISYTLRYAAPERLNDNDCINNWKSCDVFSFGMTMYSILLGQYPFNDKNNDQEIKRLIINGNIPNDYNSIIDDEFRILFIRCCVKKQQFRPSIKHVLIDIERMKRKRNYCPYTNH